jgi:hypothetical protein
MRRAVVCALMVGLVVLSGCGRSSPKLAPVRGRLTYRGHGVSEATVQLLADTSKGTHAPTATAKTEADGSFSLQTPPYGAGAEPGHYKVTVQQYHSGIPPKYGNPARTPLRVEVPEAGLSDWIIPLQD